MKPEPKIPPNFSNSDHTWDGRPFSTVRSSFRWNLLFRERCHLTRISAELNKLCYARESHSEEAFMGNVASMREKLLTWYENLPQELRYRHDLPAPLFELHAEYHCAVMLLCAAVSGPSTWGRTARKSSDDTTVSFQSISSQSEDSRHAPALADFARLHDEHALRSASLLRDFRELYSLKVGTTSIYQTQAVTSMYLLRRLDAATGTAPSIFLANGNSIRDDVLAGFEESFRCLLGSSTHSMMARGVFRMLIHTASHLRITLTPALVAALQTFQTWDPRDLKLISSSYPNHAISDSEASRADAEMETLLKAWEQSDSW